MSTSIRRICWCGEKVNTGGSCPVHGFEPPRSAADVPGYVELIERIAKDIKDAAERKRNAEVVE